jgi:putative phosphoribosyl transferase
MRQVGHRNADIVQIGRNHWRGDYERVRHSLGTVVMVQARELAGVLHGCGLSTLQLESPREAGLDGFADCLCDVLDWLHESGDRMQLGLLGADAGATAALQAAAEQPACAAAIVAIAAEPRRLTKLLPRVQAPTLLIVGGDDAGLLDDHRQALRALGCTKRLEVVPATGPLLAGPGTLDAVAHLAGAWFARHLSPSRLH